MKHRLVTALVAIVVLVVSTISISAVVVAGPAQAAPDDPDTPTTPWPADDPRYNPTISDNVILKWDDELLQVIRANPKLTGPTITARAIGVLHTATYDAWAAYDPVAKGTQLGSTLRQPVTERTPPNKDKAISFAAYLTLVDLFPDATFHRNADFVAQMTELGYTDLNDPSTPATVGRKAAQAVINFRHTDGSNQTGGYTDPCTDTDTDKCYKATNSWETVNDPWRWQPLCVPLVPYGTPCPNAVQKPLTPQWGKVKPFSLVSPLQFDVPGPPKNSDGTYSTADIDTALADTSNLSDASKAKAEYWADGPNSEFPPGHMALFAQILSRKRGDSVDTDAKMFFALGNALLDASIASWAHKYNYDFVRPITAIRERYKTQDVTSWLGAGASPSTGNFGKVNGKQWKPYQASNVVTPGFPEYVSGHSTFSGAGAYILTNFFSSDVFGAQVTIKQYSSNIEPGTTPATNVVLSWPTFTAASYEAGMSRRYGGIHFKSGDEHGRYLGRMVGISAYSKAMNYIKGYTSG
jgi:hypothetical protein